MLLDRSNEESSVFPALKSTSQLLPQSISLLLGIIKIFPKNTRLPFSTTFWCLRQVQVQKNLIDKSVDFGLKNTPIYHILGMSRTFVLCFFNPAFMWKIGKSDDLEKMALQTNGSTGRLRWIYWGSKKRDSNTGISLWIFATFFRTLNENAAPDKLIPIPDQSFRHEQRSILFYSAN